jgi:hypothetical protein
MGKTQTIWLICEKCGEFFLPEEFDENQICPDCNEGELKLSCGYCGQFIEKCKCKKIKNYDLIQTIKEIATRLHKLDIDWTLIGSTNHLLQGLNVKPNDIDILISYKDLERTKILFSDVDYKIEELPNKEAQEMKFKMNGFDIQFCFDYPHGKYHKKRNREDSIIMLDIEEIKIPAFKLEIEAECYDLANRKEKANKIREFIKKNQI